MGTPTGKALHAQTLTVDQPNLGLIENRAPRGSRGGSRGSSTRPSRTTPKSKPKSKPKSTPKSKSVSTATPKETAAVLPKLNVPYVNSATDLCYIYIDCEESSKGKSKIVRDLADPAFERFGSQPEQDIWKRTRTVGGLKIAPYPENTELYTGPRANDKKHVFGFKNGKLGSTLTTDYGAIRGSINDYATEHILEVRQSFLLSMTTILKLLANALSDVASKRA